MLPACSTCTALQIEISPSLCHSSQQNTNFLFIKTLDLFISQSNRSDQEHTSVVVCFPRFDRRFARGFIGGETKTEENNSFPSFLYLFRVAQEKRGDIITLSFEELFVNDECLWTTFGFRWWNSSTRSSDRGDRRDDDDKIIIGVLQLRKREAYDDVLVVRLAGVCELPLRATEERIVPLVSSKTASSRGQRRRRDVVLFPSLDDVLLIISPLGHRRKRRVH